MHGLQKFFGAENFPIYDSYIWLHNYVVQPVVPCIAGWCMIATVGHSFFMGRKFCGFDGFLGLPRNLFHQKLTKTPSHVSSHVS